MTTTGQPPNPPSRKFWTTKPFIISVAVVLLGGGLLVLLKDSTTLSFSFLLDGKPLLVGAAPKVELDGRPFTSGLTVTPGPHKLTADLQNAEPFEQRLWVFYGDKNLGPLTLVSSKGSLLVTVNPSPASVTVRQGLEAVGSGNAPLTVEKLVPGNYEVEIKRGEYKETHSVKVQGRQRTDKKIDLNLGSANLSSDPADGEFQLSGNGRQWDGKLPALIQDVPGGDYLFTARRKGWEISTTHSVARGETQASKIEFPYGSMEVTSDPTGLAVSINDEEVGTTPLTRRELKPGQYKLVITDGENEKLEEIRVTEKELGKRVFSFQYGTVQLGSTPPGATVVRNGKEVGTTPWKDSRILAGDTTVELRLKGYEAKIVSFHVAEGQTVEPPPVKLDSERYLQAIKRATEAFHVGQFAESKDFIARALELEPNAPSALRLRDEVSEAEHKADEARMEAEEQVNRANEKVRRREFAEQAAQQRKMFANELSRLPENNDFEIHTREFPHSFATVWRVANSILRQKDSNSIGNRATGILKQTVLYEQPTKGVLGLLGRGDYRNHWMLITPVDQETAQVELKLFNFELASMDFLSSPDAYVYGKVQSGQPYKLIRNGNCTYGLVLDKNLVRRRAAEFFDQIAQGLPAISESSVGAPSAPPNAIADASGGTPSLELREQLVTIENKIAEFQKSGDRSAIAAILDPGYTLRQDGRSFSRSDYLSTIKPMPAVVSYRIESPEARLENDRAVLTGYMTIQMRQQQQSNTFRVKFRDVFVQRDGRWLFLASEVVSQAPTVEPPLSEGSTPTVGGNAISEIRDKSLFNGMQVFEISKLDQIPQAKFRARPIYPFDMRRAGTAGEVLVGFLVDTNGDVQNAYAVKSSRQEFEAAAVQAVSKWKFKPGRKAGRDVITHMQQLVAFSMDQ
jgi:TonB family protein